MRDLTDSEKDQVPAWAYFYAVNERGSVYFANRAKTEAITLACPRLGIIELSTRGSIHKLLKPLRA